MDDESVGTRLRAHRRYRGLTLQELADQVGLSKSYLSKIENGIKPLDSRTHLHALADALDVSLADLTGVPYRRVDHVQDAALATVPAIRASLLGIDLDDAPDRPTSPWAAIEDRYSRIMPLRYKCDWAAVGRELPGLLDDLTTIGAAGHEYADEALRCLVIVAWTAADALRDLGFADLGWAASQRARQAAVRVGDPVLLALADYSRAQSLRHVRARDRALTIASRAADALAPHVGVAEGADELYGQLLLSSAFTSAILGRQGDGAVTSRLTEAQKLAKRTGDTLGRPTSWHTSFSPVNVEMWRSSIALEQGDPDRAVEISMGIKVEAMPRVSRRAGHLVERGVALAKLPKREREAVATLRRAERMAPQRVHASSQVRDTVTAMLTRARLAAGGRDLRALASRIGVVE